MNDTAHTSLGSFLDPHIQQCPFPLYDQLRQDHPVYRDPKTGNYVLTRYEDIRRVALNPKQYANSTGLIQTRDTPTTAETNRMFEADGYLPMDTLVSCDPPAHRFYRSLVDKVFTTPKVVALEPRIAQIADELIDGFIDSKEIEFVEAFAIKVPMQVIAEQLGVSSGDFNLFKRWSDCSVESTSPMLSPEREIATVEAIIELQTYMAARAEEFRAQPDESKLLSRLVNADVDGRRLNMRELMSIIQQVLVAGNETTTAAFASGMKLLIDHPSLAKRLQREPERIPTFVEETLRIMAPVQVLFRRVLADAVIAGCDIPQDSIVELRWGSANRDNRVYPRPAEPDLDRPNAQTHLAFGAGIHICIGNQLARGELRQGFGCLLDRMEGFRATGGAEGFAYSPSFISFALTRLMLGFDRR